MTKLKPGQPTDSTPHEVLPDRIGKQATELKAGVTLFTQDGRCCGNAIIVREISSDGYHHTLVEHLKKTNQKFWLIETDFGNRMKLSSNEILELYEPAYEQDYDSWWDHRIKAIEKTVD